MNLMLRKLQKRIIVSTFCAFSVMAAPALDAGNFCRRGQNQDVLHGEWPILGQNYANTQVNEKEHIINRNNVGSLEEAGDFRIVGPGVSSQPTYSEGKIYFADSLGTVYAVHANSGSIKWQINLPNNVFVTSPVVTKDIIYVASTSSFIVPGNSFITALNRDTGEILWSTPLYAEDEFAGEFPGNITAVDDLIIVPISSFLFDVHMQGRVMAFNRFTGELVWTVAATSDQFDAHPQFGPGVGIFSTGAVDTKRRLYFIGTGQTYSGVDSPLADALLAIDYCKGELVWAFKFETNDVWTPFDEGTAIRPAGTFDLDTSVPPNLFTVKVKGKKIDCVGVGTKAGKYKIFARDQENPHGVTPLAAIELDPGSAVGTIQSTPVVHDGILYIASVAVDDGFYRISNDNVYIPVITPTDPNLYELFDTASMKTMALDLEKLIKIGNTDGTIPEEAILWTVFSKGVQGRNPMAFANGVLYQTSQTGFLRALDPRNGAELFYVVVDPATGPGRDGIITAGPTVADGSVFMSYGYDPLGFGGLERGGVKTYRLP